MRCGSASANEGVGGEEGAPLFRVAFLDLRQASEIEAEIEVVLEARADLPCELIGRERRREGTELGDSRVELRGGQLDRPVMENASTRAPLGRTDALASAPDEIERCRTVEAHAGALDVRAEASLAAQGGRDAQLEEHPAAP